MAKTEDISSKIELLQERLARENETRDNVIPQSFAPSKRPNNCKDFLINISDILDLLLAKFLLIFFIDTGVSFASQ